MGYSVSVNNDTFESEVFQKSFDKPVLIDFFANWCGPCQMLKPILDNIAQDSDIVVAKVNIDDNRQLAHDYEVEGIPDVRLMIEGEIVDKFVGVLPEPQLRQFLLQHNIKSGLHQGMEAIESALDAGDNEQAGRQFEKLLETYPDNRGLVLSAAKFFIDLERLEKAEELLSSFQESDKEYYSQAQALKLFITLDRTCKNPEINSEIDKIFARASCLTVEGNYQEALEAFLEIVREDRSYKNDAARKAMVAIFELMGEENPLTREYRKQLMMALY